MVGIKETKEVLLFGLNTQKAIVSAKADGSVNWMDIGLLLPIVKTATDAYNGIENLKAELIDIDDQEQAELNQIVRQFYEKIDEAEIKSVIEETVNYVIDGVQLAVKWSKVNK